MIWLLIVLPHAIVGYAPTEADCMARAQIVAHALTETSGKPVQVQCKPVENMK